MDRDALERLRARYSDLHGGEIYNPAFRRVAERIFDSSGTRLAPYAGMPTLPVRAVSPRRSAEPDFGDLQVALLGVPMDLGVTNRNGSRFGPRALRTIERIGPYNHVLDCAPVSDLRVADIGDVPFRSRFSLRPATRTSRRGSRRSSSAGVAPLSVGGDHSITAPILQAVGADRPVGMIHIDAHCDTGGALRPDRSSITAARSAMRCSTACSIRRAPIQIGIRGSAEYLWEFSYEVRHDGDPRRGDRPASASTR